MFKFEHESLDVYHAAREFNREVYRLTKIASKGHYDHLDNLVRAGASMPRNIAEGGGEWSPKEKAKFFRYAKRSGAEAAAALDTMVDYGMLRDGDTVHGKELLGKILAMLIKLIKRFESAEPRHHSNSRLEVPTKHPGPLRHRSGNPDETEDEDKEGKEREQWTPRPHGHGHGHVNGTRKPYPYP